MQFIQFIYLVLFFFLYVEHQKKKKKTMMKCTKKGKRKKEMEKISIHNMKWNLIYNLNLPSTTIIKEKGERGQRGQCVCVWVSAMNEWIKMEIDW